MASSILGQMQAERIAQLGIEQATDHDDAWFAQQLLVQPASPYSDVVRTPSLMNELWWREVVDASAADDDQVLDALRRELGMTRARPGVDVMPAGGFRDPFVAANATKAGLEPDVFWHVLDLFGYEHAPRFASHAVGLQILREQIGSTPPARRAAVGVFDDVASRVMRARHPDELSTHDLRYLDTIVQHRLLHPSANAGLPIAWRIARAAAAFRDAQGYVTSPPCRPDGTAHPQNAGGGAPGDARIPCFVAAHDRAVHRWYVDDMRRTPLRPEPRHDGLARLGLLVGALMPLLDMLAMAEIVEAAVADDMVSADALSSSDAEALSERASRLACPAME
ncbi:hypothetical protein KPL74_15560 [Bacillus sp. NP157]|nr:hypothetical protein KPL74_15560 [Bacillus sp. NP157]